MDKIVMKNLAFFSYHGAMREENVLGQKFYLDIELTCDIPYAGISDKVEDTVHYGEIYETVKNIMENERHDLIEKVAERITEDIFAGFEKVKEIEVAVKKPEAPVPGIYDYFGVVIRRKRKEFNNRAFLGLGGNMGDKKANIEKAIELLDRNESIKVIKTSSFYETEPWGYTDQDWFMNIVAEVETELDPYELLSVCQEVEKQLKRERLIRWGPRTIDVDVLLYDGFKSDDEVLTVPHPRMTERAFVMVPLYEINQEVEINGEKISDIMKDFKGEEIKKLED